MGPTTRYQLPTHLSVPDRIDIPFIGVTISLTIRQGVIFLFGWSTAFAWWHRTIAWQTMSLAAMVAHWALPGLLALIIFIIAMLQIQGRSCEQWFMIVVHYLTIQKVFVWQSVAAEHLAIQRHTSKQNIQGREIMSTDLFSLPWNDDEETDLERKQ
jgi:small-conductance mechanosensitive channel